MHVLRRPELHAATVWLFLGALAAQAPLAAHAQGPTDGAIHGTLHDPAGKPAANTLIAVRPLDGASIRTTRTQPDGTFLLPHLAPGSYVLSVDAVPPLQPYPAQQLDVPLGDTLEVDLRFAPQAEAPFQRQAATPVNPVDAGSLAPAAATPDQDDDGLPSVHGLASTQNAVLLDGAEQTQSFASVPAGSGADPAPDPDSDSDSAEVSTGPANGLARGRHAGVAYIFSQSSVREFRVAGLGNSGQGSAQSYSAQFGRAAGAVLTTVSRSGTERVHGIAFFSLRSSALAAYDPLAIATTYANGVVQSAPVKPHDLRESYGIALGGPIPRTPLLFFYSLDQQRRGFPAISSPADPGFYSLTAIQQALLANRQVSPAKINAALSFLSSLTGSTPRRADQTINFGRIDWPRHARASLAAEYNGVRWNSPAGLLDAPVVARGRASLGSSTGSLDAAIVRVTSTFTPRTLNQARFGFLRDLQYETPQPPLAQEPAIAPGGLAPEVNIGPNGLLFGTPATLSQLAYPDERRLQLADTLTLTRGHHLIELGGDISFVHDLVATLPNPAGTFRYDSGVTKGFAGGLVDFITDFTYNVNTYPNGGCPTISAASHFFCFRTFSQSFGQSSVAFSTQESSAFIEDTWRPRRTLTLHAGARYEYTLLPVPLAPNPTLDAIFATRGATSVFPEDRRKLGPRASIAWEPLGAGRGTIRLGYGVFFGRLPGATIRSALSDTGLPSATSRIRIRPTTIVACPQAPSVGFGYPCAFNAPPTGVADAVTSAVVFARGFRLPSIQQGSVSLERSFRRTATLSATYVLNLDRQLPSSTDLNIAPSNQNATFRLQGGTGAAGVRDGETFIVPLYTARISPSFGPVTGILSNVNATYHGLVLAAASRPLRTVELRGTYIWSKAIDFGQALSATPRTDNQFDPFSNGYDKSLSSLNYPWALHLAAIWSPHPAFALNSLAAAARNWQFAPIVSARAGRPYSFDLSGGANLPGGHESINGSGGALYLPTVGRNTLRLPATVKVDLRAVRTFRATSRTQLLASAEAFNLLNHRNISSVAQRAYLVGTAAGGITPLVFQNAANIAAEGLNTQPFGTPTAASTGLTQQRQIQLSLRLQF